MCFFQGSFPAFHGSHLIEVLRALWSGYFRDSPCRSAGQRFFRRQWITWRAQTWVNDHVPYNQDLKHDGHHQDSSGYVSFAWNLKQPGTSPSGMGAVSHSIPFDGLQPGDALKNSEAHSMLFIKWVNQSKGTFIAYDIGHKLRN